MFGGVPIAKELILMIRVYHTGVTNPSSTDTTSTTASTATDSVICWTCLGLTVNIAGEYMITCCTSEMGMLLS